MIEDGPSLGKPKKPLRITFVLTRLGMSGGIRCVGQLAKALIERGNQVTVLAGKAHQGGWLPRNLRQAKQKYRQLLTRIEGRDNHLKLQGVPYTTIHGPEISPDDAPDADLVVGTWWQSVEALEHWPDSKGLKAHYVQGHDIYAGDQEVIGAVYARPYKKFAVSKWLVDLLENKYNATNVTQVPNAIDPNEFFTAPRQKPARTTIGFAYSASRVKAPEVAFEAMQLVQRKYPAVEIVTYGNAHIPRSWPKLDRHRHFILPSISQLRSIYGQCTCWMMASRSEGFGLPGFEANACGCPLVTTACRGPEEYLQDGDNGYIVPIDDVQALAEAVGRVIGASDEQWFRMSQLSVNATAKTTWSQAAACLEVGTVEALGHAEHAP